MKDTRTVLDSVRAKIPGDAKLFVGYIDANGALRCAQANCSQADLQSIADTLQANLLRERVGLKG